MNNVLNEQTGLDNPQNDFMENKLCVSSKSCEMRKMMSNFQHVVKPFQLNHLFHTNASPLTA